MRPGHTASSVARSCSTIRMPSGAASRSSGASFERDARHEVDVGRVREPTCAVVIVVAPRSSVAFVPALRRAIALGPLRWSSRCAAASPALTPGGGVQHGTREPATRRRARSASVCPGWFSA
jgi:hypothetical protein